MKMDQQEKPYIYLLSSPNREYMYDVNRNEIKNISKELYYTLKKLLRNEEVEMTEDVKDEIQLLKANGYLSNHRVSEIRHPASDFLSTFLNRKLEKITLQVTQSCNLRCAYCVYSDVNNELQRSHSGKRMNFETAKKAIDFLVEHSIDTEQVNISFYGGEPLLEFALIKKVVAYANQVLEGKSVTYSMTSNCTLLNDEMIQFFIQENIQLMVSLDGPEKIHDSCRRFAKDGSGSFKVVMKKLSYIKEHYPEFMKKIHVSMVIDPQNEFDCINSVFLDYDIFEKVNIHSSVIDDIYSVEKTSYSEDYIEKQNYQFFLAFLSQFGRLEQKYVSPLAFEEVLAIRNQMRQMDGMTFLPDVSAPGGPCIPGQLRLFVDVDGKFFPCERVNEKSTIMNIGNIEEGFDYEKVDNLLNVGRLTSEECKNCWAFHHCTLCAKYADDCGSLCKEFKLSHCQSVRENVRNTLESIVMFKEVEQYTYKMYRGDKDGRASSYISIWTRKLCFS